MVRIIGGRLVGLAVVLSTVAFLCVLLFKIFPPAISEYEEGHSQTGERASFLDLIREIGTSKYHSEVKLLDLIFERLPMTCELAGLAFLLTLFMSVFISYASWSWPSFKLALLIVSQVIFCAPHLILTPFLIWIFYFKFSIFKLTDMESLPDFLIPAVALALKPSFQLGVSFGETVGQSHLSWIKSFQALGLSRSHIFRRLLIKNWLFLFVGHVPVLLASFFSGSIIVETMFGYHGLGALFYESLASQDVPLVIGFALYFCLIFVSAQTICEMMLVILDPRLKRT